MSYKVWKEMSPTMEMAARGFRREWHDIILKVRCYTMDNYFELNSILATKSPLQMILIGIAISLQFNDVVKFGKRCPCKSNPLINNYNIQNPL